MGEERRTYASTLKEHTERGHEDGEDDLADVGSLGASQVVSYRAR